MITSRKNENDFCILSSIVYVYYLRLLFYLRLVGEAEVDTKSRVDVALQFALGREVV